MEERSSDIPRAILLPYPAQKDGKPIALADAETTIGRAPSNAVCLNHGGISRAHAVIARENGQFVLKDLNSRNGTFVNSQRIEKTVLKHQDKILFGERGFVFTIEGEPATDLSTDNDIAAVDGDTVTIGPEELELSNLLSHSAENAISNFLAPAAQDGDEAPLSLQAHNRLSYLYQLSENLRSPCAPEQILEKGLELIFKALPSAQRAAAMLRSEASGRLEVRAVRYRDPEAEETVIPVSRTVLRQVVEDRVAIISQDAQEDERFDSTDSFVVEDINSFVCVPLIQPDQVIGTIYLDTDDLMNPFVQSDMEFTAAVANELALSIYNCRLQRDVINNEKIGAIGLTVTHLAHNIKNLLTFNRSAVDLMDEQLQASENEDMKKNWQLVRQGFDRIADLTADMLDYTQSNAGDLQPVDINAAVVAEYELVKETMTGEAIEVELNLARDIPPWPMNESLLQRAILNLVANAKDALQGRENGRIRISTEIDDSARLLVRVEDNGCGIAKGIQDEIFELFYTTKGMDGSGVGLSMIKKFVEGMGGTVSVVSHVDVGSIFTLCFPGSTQNSALRKA